MQLPEPRDRFLCVLLRRALLDKTLLQLLFRYGGRRDRADSALLCPGLCSLGLELRQLLAGQLLPGKRPQLRNGKRRRFQPRSVLKRQLEPGRALSGLLCPFNPPR